MGSREDSAGEDGGQDFFLFRLAEKRTPIEGGAAVRAICWIALRHPSSAPRRRAGRRGRARRPRPLYRSSIRGRSGGSCEESGRPRDTEGSALVAGGGRVRERPT